MCIERPHPVLIDAVRFLDVRVIVLACDNSAVERVNVRESNFLLASNLGRGDWGEPLLAPWSKTLDWPSAARLQLHNCEKPLFEKIRLIVSER